MALMVPVSWGEFYDKLTILQIKRERIDDEQKRNNIIKELEALHTVRSSQSAEPQGLEKLEKDLRAVNEQLWDIEDAIRVCEKNGDFGTRFIELARAVYRTNDKRAELKYQINLLLGSDLIEEKSYQPY